jgi:hypothetical protein
VKNDYGTGKSLNGLEEALKNNKKGQDKFSLGLMLPGSKM